MVDYNKYDHSDPKQAEEYSRLWCEEFKKENARIVAERKRKKEEENERLRQKAKSITDPILLLDKYTHERAEDSETFFQTLNMELISIAGIISTLPTVITKFIPILEKNEKKHTLIKL